MRFHSLSVASILAAAMLATTPAAFAHENHDHSAAMGTSAGAVTAKVSTPKDAKPGTPVEVKLTLKNAEGHPITESDLKAPHGEKVHVLIIDPSLTDYQHVHPKESATPGEYTFTITPTKAGEYRLFADVTPQSDGKELYVPARFNIEGTAGAVARTTATEATADGYKFVLKTGEGVLSSGREQTVTLSVADAKGAPVKTLEPIMMAFAHVVAFNESATEVAHLHPEGAEAKSDADRGGPDLKFHASFPTGGFKKIFAQVKIAGKVITVPFGVDVKGDEPNAKSEVTMGAAGDGKAVEMVNNKFCPVSKDENGDMGDVLYVDYAGKRVTLCCSGCVKKFKSDPEGFLKKAEEGEKAALSKDSPK
ncbi:hypothetical protein IT570_14530 [Candidatus Sumerlaeota bacterium]|nr:hypothetical protein [Candidatus Sumerlaeota bacterium]